jgi:hypothetical protein
MSRVGAEGGLGCEGKPPAVEVGQLEVGSAGEDGFGDVGLGDAEAQVGGEDLSAFEFVRSWWPISTELMATATLPIVFRNNHLFVRIDGALWVYDTGADTSFGNQATSLLGPKEAVADRYAGQFTAADISGFLGETVAGIIGADHINRYDHIIDLQANQLTVSDGDLTSPGCVQPLAFFMGVPMLKARIGDETHNLFFDTGAQISYFQGEAPAEAVEAGTLEDFFPMIGTFSTPTKLITVGLNGLRPTLRCGQLPGMMGMALGMADVSGIIGNEVMRGRVTAFYPRRHQLILQP